MENKELNNYLKKDIELTQRIWGESPLYGKAAQEMFQNYHQHLKVNTDGIDAMAYVIKELGKTLKKEENQVTEKGKVVEKHEHFSIGDYVKVIHDGTRRGYKGFIIDKKISRPHEAKIQVTVGNENLKKETTLWIDLHHPSVYHDEATQLDRIDLKAMVDLALFWKDEEMFSFATGRLKNYKPPVIF